MTKFYRTPWFDEPISDDLNDALTADIMARSGMTPMFGHEKYRRIVQTIKENPKWFPWEHKYNSVPREIHEAYLDELNPDRHKPIECTRQSDGKGILSHIKTVEPKPLTIEMMEDFIWEMAQIDERKKQEEIRKRGLWEKHYGKYDLRYNGGLEIIFEP